MEQTTPFGFSEGGYVLGQTWAGSFAAKLRPRG